MRAHFTCSTGGNGLWSEAVRSVRIVSIVADAMMWKDEPQDKEWGELQAFFDPTDWDVTQLGLIYTDKKFLGEFRDELVRLGFSEAAAKDVGYSEMGMQGRDYVSFDIGHVFLADYRRISKEPVEPDVV